MQTRTLFLGSILILILTASKPLEGDTISATYQFRGTAQNVVIANGFVTSDGIAFGSVNDVQGVDFDTHNRVNLSNLQNFGTFTMIFPNGDTAYGNLSEDDQVSLVTFSGPFSQTLTFTGGTGEFENLSGTLMGGGFIYPTYYTTSGAGTLTGPDLVASPEPRAVLLLLVGLSIAGLGVFYKRGRLPS